VAGATAAGLLELLSPRFAEAEQIRASDPRIPGETLEIDSPQGYGKVRGYLARPAGPAGKLPALLVVHENRGLNPHIEDVARRFALEKFLVFAPDALFPLGGYPGDEDKARELFAKLDQDKTHEDFLAAVAYLESRPDCTGKIGVTGFCYGGGICNTLAVRMGTDLAAAVPFYGGAPPAADVAKIKAAILVQHGALDARLVEAWPAYEAALKAAHVTYEGYLYPGAVHGFNNDATPERYNKAAADLAWQRTIDWFNKYVRGGPGANA
jgi:carboxymethylenebutenolidase